MAQPVVRNKLAGMIARSESYQNWLENLTHQMCHMVIPDVHSTCALLMAVQSYKEQADKLAG